MERDQAPPQQPLEMTSEAEASNTVLVEIKMEDDSDMKSEQQVELDLDLMEQAAVTSIYTLPTPDSPSASNRSQQELNDRQHSRVHQVAAMTGQLDQELIRQKSLVEQVTVMTGKLDQLGKHNNDDNDEQYEYEYEYEPSSKEEKEEKKKEQDVQLEPNPLSQDLSLVDGMSVDEYEYEYEFTTSSQRGYEHEHGHGMIHHACRGFMQVAELAQEACQANNTIENESCLTLSKNDSNNNDNNTFNGVEQEPKPMESGTLSSLEGDEGLQLQLLLDAERVQEELMTPPRIIKKSHLDGSPDSVFNFGDEEEQAHDPCLQAIDFSERQCHHSPERERVHLKPVEDTTTLSSSSNAASDLLHIGTAADTTSTSTSPKRLPTSPTRRSPPRPDPDAQESSMSMSSSARVVDSSKYPSKLPSPKGSPARGGNSTPLEHEDAHAHATESAEEKEKPQEEVHSSSHNVQPSETKQSSSKPISTPPQQVHVPTPNGVYIQDDVYGWLPAKILEARATLAIVSLDLPSHWADSTIISSTGEQEQDNASTFIHKSLKGLETADDAQAMATTHKVPLHSLRVVPWKDYTEGVLPKQNSTKAKRDMVDLVQLHEAAILFNLKERHYQSQPYTRVGNILVAVNPYCWMDHLYTPETQDEYTLKLIWQGTSMRR
jgi:hypothetical protein